MYKRILIPTDGSDITNAAIAQAVALAGLTGARLFAMSVKEPLPYSAISEMQPVAPQSFYDAQESIAAARLKTVVDAASAAGLPCEAFTVEAMHPWEAIVEHARLHEIDLIVMASHGRRGVAALLLGSETQRVLTHSKVTVLVVK